MNTNNDSTGAISCTDLLKEKLVAGVLVYVQENPGCPWVKGKVVKIARRPNQRKLSEALIMMSIRSESGLTITADKYSIARIQNHGNQLKPCKRVIAGKNLSSLKPGILLAPPQISNKGRYLVYMDDGSANYFDPSLVFPILGQSPTPWADHKYLLTPDEAHENILRYLFKLYPGKSLLRAKIGDPLMVCVKGDELESKIISFDCDVVHLEYKENGVHESLYLGSPRIGKRLMIIGDCLRTVRGYHSFQPKLVFWINDYYTAGRDACDEGCYQYLEDVTKPIILSRIKPSNIARKSTTKKNTTRVDLNDKAVEDPKAIIDIAKDKWDLSRVHKCTHHCLDIADVKTELSVKDMIRDFMDTSDLKVPLLLGWKRYTSRPPGKKKNAIVYEAPCGKLCIFPYQVAKYLTYVDSRLDVDYFSFDLNVKLNRVIAPVDCYHYLRNLAIDRVTGVPLENKFVSVLNPVDEERLPDDFIYRNETFPHPELKKKGFEFDYYSKSGCFCEDDCNQKKCCSCRKLTEIQYCDDYTPLYNVDSKCQYKDKRLMDQVTTGIFECNSYCNCSSKCGNRVVQNGIRYRFQITKTLSKGWGVRTLDDIPIGAFICTYSAELLDDADQYGDSDMYYADLDYISVNERQKLDGDNYSDDEGVQVIEPKDDSDSDITMLSQDTSEGKSEEEVQSRAKRPRFQKDKLQPARRLHDVLGTHDYTLDARCQGNIGRFFNHSCDPNAYVQNVFTETHDPRFPIVAFFANRTIKADEEITWNYNYMMGSIEGRRIDCHCEAKNCRGRIL